ncbi:MAG: hypothetical protein KatS3mg085_062 [Candidatus Dojkabacteria bacterium]|nr:MAG: hypothetical protein KatS3mg085_062 [Candidatus Dojkabacteria bacterium]
MKNFYEWYYEKYFSKNEIYEFENGFRLVLVEKKNLLDFNVDIVLQAGSFFDSFYDFHKEHHIFLNT